MEIENINKTISKSNEGFPEYLDFKKLRSDSIKYLGRLSGKIWTDHNVHDPGITIMEMLIYAIMDLGYRTNLPLKDLLARDPADKSRDNNFFQPAEILGCNPLTITDLRKLLVDIPGVKNAWLEVEENLPAAFCDRPDQQPGILYHSSQQKDPCDCQMINGLYHVYLQLEKDVPENKHRYSNVLSTVRKQLMAHRNLCEDFIDIKVLCSVEVGVCAGIDLKQDADEEEVYMQILLALQQYFSPAPKFYTFQQLVEKGRTVEEIFAGRPLNIRESHGFLDTDEFEKMELRKVLNLSDLYQVIFSIDGVKNVRNLGWLTCCGEYGRGRSKADSSWQLGLPKDHIAEFSVSCSGFQFTREGVSFDFDKSGVEQSFVQGSSGLYQGKYLLPEEFLGPVTPKGNYRPDLANYNSIQTEFPKVYGISEGALGGNVAVSRKAQARQLQGFLLFFDQLLANYLTQLQNIRSLFSISSRRTSKQTYFTNRLSDVPHFSELTRFRTGEGLIGNEGSILAYPVSRKKLEKFIQSGRIRFSGPLRKCNDKYLDDFPVYLFCHGAERDQAVRQLREDFTNDDISPVVVSNENDCYFFYILTSSADFALMSKDYYPNEQEAMNAAASLKYAAHFNENYRSYITERRDDGEDRFSFDVELNLNSYNSYLQLIAENPALYSKRRQQFLDHLLARFAEKFTDYAMLSSPFNTAEVLLSGTIDVKEKFLSGYPLISSERGKAYDHSADGWNNSNISGFERRVKALTGIQHWDRRYHCNFIVEKADEQYRLVIELFDDVFEVADEVFDRKHAVTVLKSMWDQIAAKPAFRPVQSPVTRQWHLGVEGEGKVQFLSRRTFATVDEAEDYGKELTGAFKFHPEAGNVFAQTYVHKIKVSDARGKPVATSSNNFDSVEQASEFMLKMQKNPRAHLSDENEFDSHFTEEKPGKLLTVQSVPASAVLIDQDIFRFRQMDTYQLSEKMKKFSVLNKAATIQFDSLQIFKDVKDAKESYKELLSLLADKQNYHAETDLDEGVSRIFIMKGSEKKAVYYKSLATIELANDMIAAIWDEVSPHVYNITISDPVEHTWEFSYEMAVPGSGRKLFRSRGNYRARPQAEKGAAQFYANIRNAELKTEGDELILFKRATKMQVFSNLETEEDEQAANRMLRLVRETETRLDKRSEPEITAYLERYRINEKEQFIYKLVDRNNVIASHPALAKIPDKATAETRREELVQLGKIGYDQVNIALAGDIVFEKQDPVTKLKRYHYRLRVTNRYYSQGSSNGQSLVLFESAAGYENREEAKKAFEENYPDILRAARLERNYGKGRIISTEVISLQDSHACTQSATLVYVPKETSDEYGGYEIQRHLVVLVRNFPLRFIRKNKIRYSASRIINGQVPVVVEDWRSNKSFRSAREAMQAYDFFLLLLKYSGNYFIDHDDLRCEFGIHIREVLAVSAHGFHTEEDAWGSEGIEKFICVTQGKNGFHNFWNDLTCGYSFYVARGDHGMVHPCSYETPGRRDTMVDRLWNARQFNFFDLVRDITNESIVLTDLKGDWLAWVHMDERVGNFSVCEWLILFIETMQSDENYGTSATGPYLKYKYRKPGDPQYQEMIIAESLVKGIGLKEWKKKLLQIVCYFPIYRTSNKSAGEYKYHVDIKLPGFISCEDYLADDCIPNDNGDCELRCHTAWQVNCCFDTCCDAIRYFAFAYAMMQDRGNYKSLFDCTCGSYRIRLHPRLSAEGKKKLYAASVDIIKATKIICPPEKVRLEYSKRYAGRRPAETNYGRAVHMYDCFGETIAINPQQYGSEKSGCEAVERAKKLINSEGMHLVEHILLRPRCRNVDGVYEECGMESQPRPYSGHDINCSFEWKPGGDVDVCEEEKEICFAPGCDPYSFIATVFLPAWPERFRGNREMMEKILRREAPAHVMLRILWLSPRDFCCMERHYKMWSEWLAMKLCDDNYSPEAFLDFLFDKRFETMGECEISAPCGEQRDKTSCFEEPPARCEGSDVNDNIRDLFGWERNLRDEYYQYCKPAE